MGILDTVKRNPVKSTIAGVVLGLGAWYVGCRGEQPLTQAEILDLPVAEGYLSIGGENDACHIEQYVVDDARQPHLVCQDGDAITAWALPDETPEVLKTYLTIKNEATTAQTSAMSFLDRIKNAYTSMRKRVVGPESG